MAHTLQRLTLYALLSALERDLRDFITLHIGPLVSEDQLIPEAIRKKALERLLKDDPEANQSLDELVEYLDLGEEIQIIRSHEGRLDELTRSYIKKYYTALEGTIPVRNRVMHSRPLDFDDLPRVSDFASELVRSHRTLWANLRGIRRDLERNPEFVASLHIPELPDENTKVLHNLPQVEFDDTGFVGRERELSELRRALRGSYPIITVVGEGGLGKTALAMKACYDLLDEEETPLDAIVWTTAKTTKLTSNEIQVIEGAISSSLGILESASNLLGRQNTEAMDDLLLHLENNRILLVIDNLETVIDHNIRELVKRVPAGSKILFTTRIGLGAFDFPVPLTPLSPRESAFYFRRAARVWGVQDLATSANAVIDGYCTKLQHNPLFIKWFIQSVRAGQRPSALVSNPETLLQFCLQNVFNSLSSEARTVASTLATVNGGQSVASLGFYTDLDSLSVQAALSILITSNLVITERGRSSEDDDRYTISPLARLYIQKFIRPSVEEQKALIKKQNSLRSAQEEYAARVGADIFDINTIFVRDRDDYIVAKYLTRSMEYMFKDRLDDAKEQLSRARDLSPNYFEVHRVAALISVAEEDFFSAESEYEAAISLAPERAPLRLWYAGFLSRHLGDQDRALAELRYARQLSPDSTVVRLELSRVLQYLKKFDEAADLLSGINDVEKLSARTRRVHLDLCIQNNLRKAEFDVGNGSHLDGLSTLEAAVALIVGAPRSLIDQRTVRSVGRTRRLFLALERAFRGLKEFERVIKAKQVLSEWERSLHVETSVEADVSLSLSAPLPATSQLQVEPPNRGRLVNLHQNYGFVATGVSRLFFHRGSWVGSGDFRELGEGTIVEFSVGMTDRGEVATDVRPIGEAVDAIEVGQSFVGRIKALTGTFGFITPTAGLDIFFHRSDCLNVTNFGSLKVGDEVRAILILDDKKRRRAQNVEPFLRGGSSLNA